MWSSVFVTTSVTMDVDVLGDVVVDVDAEKHCEDLLYNEEEKLFVNMLWDLQ